MKRPNVVHDGLPDSLGVRMIGISLGDIFSVIDFLAKKKESFEVKSALFSSEGKLIAGDSAIVVDRILTDSAEIWFYRVRPIKDYEFVYSPVIPSLHVDYGSIQGEKNSDATIFRFVANSMAQFAAGGLPNVKSNFMIVAYKPKDLLRIRENK